MTELLGVYKAIAGVMADIGETGIAKSRNNAAQNYKFRGIDDVYNELNGLLSKHRLLLLPNVVAREQVERSGKSGGALFFTNVTVEFTLVCADDGSKAIIKTVGEAMDSGDKSSNKALSAAYKYAAMMLFCIPTEGDNDADATTPEIKGATKAATRDDFKRLCTELAEIKTWDAYQLWSIKNADGFKSLNPDLMGNLQHSMKAKEFCLDIAECRTADDLNIWNASNKADYGKLSQDAFDEVATAYKERKALLSKPTSNPEASSSGLAA